MKKLETTVLVVEDDLELRHAITESLKRNRCFVVEAGSVREASIKIKNQEFDCAFLDMRLGDESGQELIELMREDRKDQLNMKTPIVVISGHLDKDLVEGIAGKVQGALVKPFETKALLNYVEKFRSK